MDCEQDTHPQTHLQRGQPPANRLSDGPQPTAHPTIRSHVCSKKGCLTGCARWTQNGTGVQVRQRFATEAKKDQFIVERDAGRATFQSWRTACASAWRCELSVPRGRGSANSSAQYGIGRITSKQRSAMAA